MLPPSPLPVERINIRVIDPFTIKPLDSKTIIDNARATRGRIITVEDHYYEGGEVFCASLNVPNLIKQLTAKTSRGHLSPVMSLFSAKHK